MPENSQEILVRICLPWSDFLAPLSSLKIPLTEPRSNGTNCTMTFRTRSGARLRPPLTELENEVMQVVWDSGPCAVEAVHQVVARTRDLKETSVRTILRRLEQKGYLEHAEQGRAYIYRAAETPRNLAA